MRGTIPSPRKLNLKRFERPDFRSTTRRGKRAAGWTWSRALYRLRQSYQRWVAALDRDIIQPIQAAAQTLSRGLAALRARHPVWQGARRPDETTAYAMAYLREQADELAATQFRRTGQRQPYPQRTIGVSGGESARESVPARSTARRKGAAQHRLENLTTLPHQAYLSALNARQAYVIANLLRLKGLAARRAFGEPTFREARRADHYATA